MISRLISVFRMAGALLGMSLFLPKAHGDPERWRAFDFNKALKEGEAKDNPALDPYHKASMAAVVRLAQKKQEKPDQLELRKDYRPKSNESSSSIDLGVVADFPEVKLKIDGHVHYYFEGQEIPKLLGENITMTFNISAQGEGGAFFIRSLDAILITNQLNEYRPRTDGMGSIDEDEWRFTYLVIMDEKSVRRLLKEELGVLDLGLVMVTSKDRVVKGLEMLLADMDERRKP